MTDNTVLADSFGRRVATLRVSLTDHCNFRCVYCMPPEGLPVLKNDKLLTAAEIARFARIVARHGVGRVRLTGGEPLLRPDVIDVVTLLRSVPGIREISLTTNGSLLERLARPLRDAGLDRINVSLDSVDPDKFARVTRTRQFDRVRAGLDAAVAAGFPIKLNVVVLSGMTPGEIVEFARMAYDDDIDVRFLEFMPLCGTAWEPGKVMSIAEVRNAVRERYQLEELPRGDRPAQTFRIVGGAGRVGFIASLSEPFCDRCSRMRLTADGNIRPCLFSNYQVGVGKLLKNGATDTEIEAAIRRAVWNKPWGNEFMERPFADGDKDGRRAVPAPFIRSIGG